MLNFDWVRTLKSKPVSEGRVRILGPMVDELEKIGPGQVLILTSESGRQYIVARYEDVRTAESESA